MLNSPPDTSGSACPSRRHPRASWRSAFAGVAATGASALLSTDPSWSRAFAHAGNLGDVKGVTVQQRQALQSRTLLPVATLQQQHPYPTCEGKLHLVGAALGLGIVNLPRHGRRRRSRRATISGAMRRAVYDPEGSSVALKPSSVAAAHDASAIPGKVLVYSAPQTANLSLWHDIDLHVRSWLNEDTGIFRYVNEIPLGALQKFEVMPDAPRNAISEDEEGSKGLRTYGVPVPFNYGCFPQTYRDPNDVDAISGVGGDDDPLDVLDLGTTTMDVGAVVRCRPLAAVCLIDKGQADWKILTVNVDEDGPLAKARSIEEVEKIMPGRVSEVLGWIDGLKKRNREGNLDGHIHGIEQAIDLLERDHASWRRLLHETGPDGRARGHWITFPDAETSSHSATSLLPVALPSAQEDLEHHGNLMEPKEALTSCTFRDPQVL